jgi:hypothetical protein
VSSPVNPGAADEPVPEGLRAEDLHLGKRAVRLKTIACVIAFLACLGIAVFVLSSVPWDARMPYSGRFGRNGIPAPIAMLPCLLVLFGFWRTGRKPDAHHMGKGSRVGYYILAPVIIVGCVLGQ